VCFSSGNNNISPVIFLPPLSIIPLSAGLFSDLLPPHQGHNEEGLNKTRGRYSGRHLRFMSLS